MSEDQGHSGRFKEKTMGYEKWPSRVITEPEYKVLQAQVLYERLTSQEALFAYQLIERWGMVAATNDGEDSAGRAKLRLLTEEELVARAYRTSELFHAEAVARGWVADLGTTLSPEQE